MKIDLITADTGPLIHLAQIDMLDLLKNFGNVHIPDLVVLEATIEGKPYAHEIKSWLLNGVESGFVKIAETETGRAVHLARITDPSFRMKDGGERAILDWPIDTIDDTDTTAMVIYENGKVPKLINNHSSELSAAVLTTRSFFDVCELKGYLPSAEAAWTKLLKASPTTNPAKSISLHGSASMEYKP